MGIINLRKLSLLMLLCMPPLKAGPPGFPGIMGLQPGDCYAFAMAVNAFLALGFHTPGTMAKAAGSLPLGESAIFLELLRANNFGQPGTGPGQCTVDPFNAQVKITPWRMWEYLAALVFSSGFQWASLDAYCGDNAGKNLTSGVRNIAPSLVSYVSDIKWGTSVDPNFGNNRTNLIGGFVQAVFNKYCTIIKDATKNKIGAQAKTQKLTGTTVPAKSDSFTSVNLTSGLKPLYLSINHDKLLVSTNKVDPADRANTVFPNPLVQPFYKDLVSQNSIVSISGGTQTTAFDASATDKQLYRYWIGLSMVVGNLLSAFSNLQQFSGQNQKGNGGFQGQIDGQYIIKSSWLTFNSSGFSNILNGTLPLPQYVSLIDTPLLGGISTPEKVAKFNDNNNYFVYGQDGQIYRSDFAAPFLKYRDACYDVSAGNNVVAILAGFNDEKNNNGAFAAKWLAITTLPTTARKIPVDSLNIESSFVSATNGDLSTTVDTIENNLTNSRANSADVFYNSVITSNIGAYVGVPAGEDHFTMVEVGMDGAVWALGNTGKPYYIKNNNLPTLMMSPIQTGLAFSKIYVGAHKAFRVLGLTAKGEIYVLSDAETGLWNNTGQTGTHASIDQDGNWAIIGLDDTIYIAIDNNIAPGTPIAAAAAVGVDAAQIAALQASLKNAFSGMKL